MAGPVIMWLLHVRLVACTLKRLYLQLYRPIRERRESLTPDRWLLLALLPPAIAVLVALLVCLFAHGQAGQLAVGGAAAIFLAAAVYSLLALQASFFGPTAHNAEQALAALQDRKKALLAEIVAARSRSPGRRPAQAIPTPPRQPFQTMGFGQGAPTRPLAVFERKSGYRVGCFSPNGRVFAVMKKVNSRYLGGPTGRWSNDWIAELWELTTAQCTAVLDVGNLGWAENGGRALCFSPNGALLAVSSGVVDEPVQLWDVQSGNCVSKLRQHHGSDYSVHTVDFAPDGSIVAAIGTDHSASHLRSSIDLWDVATRRWIAGTLVEDYSSDDPSDWKLYDYGCYNARFLVLTSGASARGGVCVHLLDVQTCRPVGSYNVRLGDKIAAMRFDEQGRLVLFTTDDSRTKWCLECLEVSKAGRPVRAKTQPLTLPIRGKGVLRASADFKLVAIQGADACSEVYDISTGACLAKAAGTAIGFSPDNQVLVTSLDQAFGKPALAFGLWAIPPGHSSQGADRPTAKPVR